MMEDLIRLCEEACGVFLDASDSSYVRVVSHNDADGISSAAIICTALFRRSVPFHVSFVERFDQRVLEMLASFTGNLVVLCDMGSGQPGLLEEIEHPVVVLDHHRPVGKHDCLLVNPHLAGFDGAFELSASGVAYMVARLMGSNVDLSGLALLGALGDKQSMVGANRFILDEAVSGGVVEMQRGLLLEGDVDVREALVNSFEPYFTFSGDPVAVDKFLLELGISGRIDEMDAESHRRLASALVLSLLKRGCLEAIDSVVGERYVLKHELISDAHRMVSVVNACGKLEEPDVGMALCLRDESVLSHARELEVENRRSLIEIMKKAEALMREMEHIRYVVLSESSGTGAIAGAMVRYLFPDKPFIGLNRMPDIVKVSGRGTRRLVSQGLDLASALSRAAESVGGAGGGHSIASGASIPPGCEEEFLHRVNEVVGEQLLRGVQG